MNQRKLLLQLLPGFIPLIVFIIADEIWGTKTGLIVAVVLGIFELIYIWFKDHKFDKFILLDVLLIVILGVISIVLDNDVFFKLKPALIGLLTCIIIGISTFTPANILLNMSKRYMKDIEFNNEQYGILKKKTRVLFWLFLVYTILVFYSVWFMSTESWAFISGGLFYVLFGIYFAFEIISNKLKRSRFRNEEWLPVLNEKGEIKGKAPRSSCHSNKELLHPVIHLHLLNKKGEIYLQKRPLNKEVQPGKWDTAVGGHISFGETIETGLKREAFEEIGIINFKAQLVAKYIWESDVEREFVFCFVTHYDDIIKPNPQELSEGKFWKQSEIRRNLGKGIFTPNFEEEFKKIFEQSQKLV